MDIDHIVLWVDDPRRSAEFYVDVLGMTPVRLREYHSGSAGFPSVRLNDSTILDLVDKRSLAGVQEFTGGADSGGAPMNHVCLAVDANRYAEIRARVAALGLELTSGGERSFGARGLAERSEYFCDPDGNVIEIRHYG